MPLPQPMMYLTLFLAGLSTMAVEFGASRLLGNVFGTSNIVWAVIIGLVLVYLTAGNWLGGKWADRNPDNGVFFTIIALAGATTALIPIISQPVLGLSADAFDALNLPVLAGSFLAVLILFSIPVTLLGMVTPFALRLLIKDTSRAGNVAGKVSAISTLGSFVGTFLTVLVAIPALGTYRTFLITSLVLFLISLPGLFLAKRKGWFWAALAGTMAVLILAVLGKSMAIKHTSGQIFEDESAYNYIQVLELDGFRFLRLNEGQGVHSIYHPTQIFYGGPWDQMLVAPFFNPGENPQSDVKRIAILGLAGGTTARQASVAYPEARVEGYEIDPEIVRVGEQFFGMQLPNLDVHVEDARWGIAHSAGNFDLISVDAYQAPYIPPHMVTQEFFEILRDKLNAGGVVAINVGRSPTNRSLVDGIASTLAGVFPVVFSMDLPDSYNSILFACMDKSAGWVNVENAYQRIHSAQPGSFFDHALQMTLPGREEINTTGIVFTDDRAPIEAMTNRLVLDYLVGEELEKIP